MKAINHTFTRDIKSNLSYYISIILLTALTVFFVVLAFSDAAMIEEDIASVMEAGVVEDAQFQTALVLSEEDVSALEKEYENLIEQTMYIDIEHEGKTLRVFMPMDKVNKYQLLEGSDIKADYEILLDRDFATANNIAIGDTYVVEGISFDVVGLAIRPDYIYSLEKITDPWIDKENFGMIQLNESTYQKLIDENKWTGTVYYSVAYKNDDKVQSFRTALYDDYNAYQYLSADANSRIDMPRKSGDELLMMAWCIGPILFFVIMMLVSVVIGKTMDRERKHIGTLMSFGYRKREISFHYCLYAFIPAIIGGIIGVLLALLAGESVAMYFVVDYQMLNYNYYLRAVPAVCCVVAPVVLYGLIAYYKSTKLFKQNIVSLLLGREDSKKKKRHMLEKSTLNFRAKFRIRELFSHFGRTLLVLLCLFLSAYVCLLGFSLQDSANLLIDEGVKSATVYPYSYFLNHMESVEDYGEYKGLSVSYEVADNHSSITLNGVPENSAFKDMEMLEGEYTDSGYYISNAVSVERDLHKGDQITIANTVTLEETTITINGVVNDNTQQAIFTSYANVKEITGVQDGVYNVVYSNEELDIDSDQIAYVSDNDSLVDSLQSALTALEAFIYGMMFIGCLLAVISVYLIVNILVQDNRTNISMLKVLGYRNKEINRIVLSTNHILVLIGFIIAVPACIGTMSALSAEMVAMMHIVLTPHINVSSIIIGFAIILLSYFLSLLLLRRKVNKVDMVVALKENRE